MKQISPPFLVTTPIYYPNGVPHIGHAYSSLIADVIARWQRMNGAKVRFTTGVDENSQKIVEKARELGQPVMEYLDEMALAHRAVWDGTGISYTDFVRTTAPSHRDLVQQVLQKSFDRGDIYAWEYEGAYCVGCEAFKKPSDLTPAGKCPDHPNLEIQQLKEKNYFFKLSRYQDALTALYSGEDFEVNGVRYEGSTHFVAPTARFNEVIEFTKWGLEDFSISRETNKFGIPLPFDPEQVTYVWYDALFNYVSILGDERDATWSLENTSLNSSGAHTPANVLHVVGKDIIRFHAIFWPAMLMSAGYALPRQILTTGFFTVDGQKISKTIGNVIDPVAFSAKYPDGRDLMLNYILTAFPIGQDGDFSEREAVLAFNNKLANTLGNLLNRFLVLGLPFGTIPLALQESLPESLQAAFVATPGEYVAGMQSYDLRAALYSVYDLMEVLNKYIDDTKPWTMKTPDTHAKLLIILSHVGYGLRMAGILLYPFFTHKMTELLTRIGRLEDVRSLENGEFSKSLLSFRYSRDVPAVLAESHPDIFFTITEKGVPLYMRLPV
jgi:methionyl-tRNA synthetase